MGIVDEMLSRYPRETEAEETNAFREVMQEIALAGLQRVRFFEKAVFLRRHLLTYIPRFAKILRRP